MALLTPLDPEQQVTFLVTALSEKTLRKLVGQLGTSPPGTRLDTLSAWQLADSLVDYYATDGEVATAVDRMMRREIGESPLATAVAAEGGAKAVRDLLLANRDPARDLAWALLQLGTEEAGPFAAECVQSIVTEFDEADRRAKEKAEQPPDVPDAERREAERRAREAEKAAERARGEQEKATRRVDTLKSQVADLEQRLLAARTEVREVGENLSRTQAERDQLMRDRDALRGQVQAGTAAEVARLGANLAQAERRIRTLEAELEDATEQVAERTARLRALEQAASAQRPAEPETEVESTGTAWHLPVLTDEFYDSIRRWDRRIVRTAFDRIHRLAEDWRHPSLRAIPLEGLPEYYRVRVATDVRLIYRLQAGARIEVLSLIDREDLQRYVRHKKER